MSASVPAQSRTRRWLRMAAIAAGVLFVAGATFWLGRFEVMRWREGLPTFSHTAGESTRQDVAMPDGIRLSTHVHLPQGEGPWPAVLIRNPYERFDVVARSWCGLFVRYGYACVYQDVRGQMGSEGEWSPLMNEGADGHATLDWMRTQVWLDGNIALFGPSYLAAVQWAAASEGFPPEVKTFIPTVFATDLYRVVYENGMFRHETFTAWAALNPVRGMRTDNGPAYQAALRHRPHVEADQVHFGTKIDWYRDWILSERRSEPLWHIEAFERLLETPAKTRVPVLMIGGWYDVFLGPQLEDFRALASRDESLLVIGPWTHIGMGSDELENPDSGGGLTQWSLVFQWIGHHLKGEPMTLRPGVQTYAIGADRWIQRSNWPPPARPTRLHLTDLESAHACDGGRLSATAPTTAEQARYRYDPADPVPTRGGAGMLAFVLPGFDGAKPANVSQTGLCERPDVLTFMTDTLDEPVHIAGPIRFALTVQSDAPDTAFTARLIEVFADGRELNVRDGIMRVAHREGGADWAPYAPGDEITLEFETWPIEWKTHTGSRLRLDVSSSDFPKYHAHPNRAGRWAEQSGADVAEQTLLAGLGRATWVEWAEVTGHRVAGDGDGVEPGVAAGL